VVCSETSLRAPVVPQPRLHVNVAGDVGHDPVESVALGGRRDDEHEIESELVARLAQGVGLLRGEVGDDEPLDAGGGRTLDEAARAGARAVGRVGSTFGSVRSVLVDQIVVGHTDHGGVDVEFLREREEPVGRHPGVE